MSAYDVKEGKMQMKFLKLTTQQPRTVADFKKERFWSTGKGNTSYWLDWVAQAYKGDDLIHLDRESHPNSPVTKFPKYHINFIPIGEGLFIGKRHQNQVLRGLNHWVGTRSQRCKGHRNTNKEEEWRHSCFEGATKYSTITSSINNRNLGNTKMTRRAYGIGPKAKWIVERNREGVRHIDSVQTKWLGHYF